MEVGLGGAAAKEAEQAEPHTHQDDGGGFGDCAIADRRQGAVRNWWWCWKG